VQLRYRAHDREAEPRPALSVTGGGKPLEQPFADRRIDAGTLVAHRRRHALRIGGDPHLLLFPLSTSEGARPGALARNFSFYRNPRLDDVLIRASQLSSRVERARLYQRAQALLADDMPWIPIYVRLVWGVTRPEVRNLRLHPTGLHRLNTVTLEPGS